MCIGCCRWSNQRADSAPVKIIFCSNMLVFVLVRAGVWENLKLFSKNVLDVSWRL